MRDLSLTPAQFLDLTLYVSDNGKFTGWAGMDWQTLSRYQVIDEPGNPPEGVTLYLDDGWPVAVYAFDTGYTVIQGALLTAL
jgi:hypothetical protein